MKWRANHDHPPTFTKAGFSHCTGLETARGMGVSPQVSLPPCPRGPQTGRWHHSEAPPPCLLSAAVPEPGSVFCPGPADGTYSRSGSSQQGQARPETFPCAPAPVPRSATHPSSPLPQHHHHLVTWDLGDQGLQHVFP